MIKTGQKVMIDPFIHIRTYGLNMTCGATEGVVNFVHPTHKWFNVKYSSGGVTQLIGYKFYDIGRTVKVVN